MSLTGKSSEGSKVIHHSAWTSIWVTVAYVSPIIDNEVTGTSFVGFYIYIYINVFKHLMVLYILGKSISFNSLLIPNFKNDWNKL